MKSPIRNLQQHFIDGQWIDASHQPTIELINPATEECIAHIPAGTSEDVDRAVAAARHAFKEFSASPVASRLTLLESILDTYNARAGDIAEAISSEMGAPIQVARGAQTRLGADHLRSALNALKNFVFETEENGFVLRKEPIGVCGLITPWNWPMNQIAAKVAPAIAAGCTMVLKPSEESPLSAIIFAEIMQDAGVPAGVFNLVHGYGPEVGQALSTHPDVDKVSFTGSTRGGIAVAKAAADSVKRVGQELGGKSANVILEDADLESAVKEGVLSCMHNSGQSCNAPTRMLVHRSQFDRALQVARDTAESVQVNSPEKEGKHIGPVVNERQFDKIQGLIQAGIDEGADLISGGTGRPEGLDRGYYVRPTVFACPDNSSIVAQEEIFGPVLAMVPYGDEQDAIAIANDTRYGLAAYVSSENHDHAMAVARELRAGQVAINYVGGDANTPFGGYGESGNGREKGRWGLDSYLEVKAITGSRPPS